MFEFLPHYLMFEFTYNMILRKSQVELVDRFIGKLDRGESMCHQMIMGAGKTTVVAPLLALLLADGKTLTMQVVPHALLEMSRNVMREKFSAVIRKPVFTFYFDRFMKIDSALYSKIKKSREMKAVVVASPTSVKSFILKFVEQAKNLEKEKEAGTGGAKKGMLGGLGFMRDKMSKVIGKKKFNEVSMGEAYYCTETLKIFRSGVLLLDEVDLLLHPLKSELNWPMGEKTPLDFTRSSVLGIGVRWQLQWHLFDAIFYASEGRMTVSFEDSMNAIGVLNRLKEVIVQGKREKALQETPHLVVLDRAFYQKKMRPLLAEWMLLFMRSKKLGSVEDQILINYISYGPEFDKGGTGKIAVALTDEYMKVSGMGVKSNNMN